MRTRGRAWSEYWERFRRETLPMIMSSAVSLSIYCGDGSDFDVKHATELGAMLLLDKPLILVCAVGAVIPSRLRRAADVVIEDWNPLDPSCQARIEAAISALRDTLP